MPIDKKRLRRWLRAAHRDIGYLGVGLTVVYALSGIAVNHIEDWEPNQTTVTGELPLEAPAQASDQELAALVSSKVLGSEAQVDPDTLYRVDALLEFQSADTRFQVDNEAQTIRFERDEDRFFLKTANWLHLNRGKKAWTFIADTYAVALLFLALSGLWMIPGKRGLWGRGIILVAIGAAVPVAYVHFSKSSTPAPIEGR